MGDGNGDAGADVVFFVAAEVAGMENVPALLQGLGEVVAAAVFFAAAGVGYGEDVDVERAEVGCGHVCSFAMGWGMGFQAALGYMIGQPEIFAKSATDGASAARQHFLNQQSSIEYAIWRRAVAVPF